jgi:hypothetical protein
MGARLAVMQGDLKRCKEYLAYQVGSRVIEEYRKRMDRDHPRGWAEEGRHGGMGIYLPGDEGQHPRFSDRRHTKDTATLLYSSDSMQVNVKNAGAILEEGASPHPIPTNRLSGDKFLYFWGLDRRQGWGSVREEMASAVTSRNPRTRARQQAFAMEDLSRNAGLQQRRQVQHPGYKPDDRPLNDSMDYTLRFGGGWTRDLSVFEEIMEDRRGVADREEIRPGRIARDLRGRFQKVPRPPNEQQA